MPENISIFKLEHSLEPNFHFVTNKALRDVLVSFRPSICYIKAPPPPKYAVQLTMLTISLFNRANVA